MKINQRRIAIVLSIAIFLINCGLSTPSESDARAIFEKKYEQEIKDGLVKVTKFKKVDGQSGELAGVKFYTFQYEAEIEYPKGLHPECENPGPGISACGFWIKFKAVGAKETSTGKIQFEKTENGWKPINQN